MKEAMMTAVTITDGGDQVLVSFDPPGSTPNVIGPLLAEALVGEAIRMGMSRQQLAELLRDYARQIEAMSDAKYSGSHIALKGDQQ